MENQIKSYASALLEIALEEKDLSGYLKEAKEINRTIKENPEVLHLLSSAFLNEKEKDEAVEKIYGQLDHHYLVNFIALTARNGYVYRLDAILREFIREAERELGIAHGVIYSSLPLSKEEINAIEKTVSEHEGVKAELENEADKSLIGGFRIILQGKVIDYSLESALGQLRKSLKEGENKDGD